MDSQPPDESARQSKPHHLAKWSEIIAVVESSGGHVEKTESGYALVRKVGTMLLHFPLPSDFDPAHPDDNCLQPSPMALYSIERNLDVQLPYYHVM